MDSIVQIGGHSVGLGTTSRQDRWWVGPVLTVAGIVVCFGYLTWAMLQGNHYWYQGYLSPLYSPLLFVEPSVAGAAPVEHGWIGSWPTWWPSLLPVSPAFLVLAFPGAFRMTCYYYRKAYYRAFSLTPPSCAVGGVAQSSYKGETRLLLFQNLHRYAMYFAILYIPILYYDAFIAFFENGEVALDHLGVGVGSLVLLTNATLLAGFTFGCHAWRHAVGGKLDCFSCDAPSRVRYKVWSLSSILNARHQLLAWVSLFWVAFTDLYVRLASTGAITDYSTWG